MNLLYKDLKIREYKISDISGLTKCIIELQDFERTFEPDRFKGSKMAKKYLNYLIKECAANKGKIFVAEDDGNVAGFVSAWIERDPIAKIIVKTHTYFYISDLIVRKKYRRSGIGEALINKVEELAVKNKIKLVRICVLAKNKIARSFYQELGYRDYDITITKNLR